MSQQDDSHDNTFTGTTLNGASLTASTLTPSTLTASMLTASMLTGRELGPAPDAVSTDAYSYYADNPVEGRVRTSMRSELLLADGPLSADDFFYSTTQDLADNQRWSTWADVQKGCHGPQPRPDWVVTDSGAIDSDLGVLKTGKEADVFLVERAVPEGRSSLLAAKRYRSTDHRNFHRDAGYVEGRRVRRSRDGRAMAKGTAFGREVAAGQWAGHEWGALCSLWSAGLPVPYPVQLDGTEILMEFIDVDGAAAPRLAQLRPDRATLESYFDQMREAMSLLARRHVAHGDLSPYNILAQGERLVIIDLPQIVDIVGNPAGVEFLQRDCRNVCQWFVSRGLDVDAEELFGELLAQAW